MAVLPRIKISLALNLCWSNLVQESASICPVFLAKFNLINQIIKINFFSIFSEDLVLAEERTSEKDKKRIMEGKNRPFYI